MVERVWNNPGKGCLTATVVVLVFGFISLCFVLCVFDVFFMFVFQFLRGRTLFLCCSAQRMFFLLLLCLVKGVPYGSMVRKEELLLYRSGFCFFGGYWANRVWAFYFLLLVDKLCISSYLCVLVWLNIWRPEFIHLWGNKLTGVFMKVAKFWLIWN